MIIILSIFLSILILSLYYVGVLLHLQSDSEKLNLTLKHLVSAVIPVKRYRLTSISFVSDGLSIMIGWKLNGTLAHIFSLDFYVQISMSLN